MPGSTRSSDIGIRIHDAPNASSSSTRAIMGKSVSSVRLGWSPTRLAPTSRYPDGVIGESAAATSLRLAMSTPANVIDDTRDVVPKESEKVIHP